MCHRTNGTNPFILITIAESAVPAHRAHGDAAVGEPVPGDPSKIFDDHCVPTAPSPAPTIAMLDPDHATSGDAGFTLTVHGTGFVPASIVRWNGYDRPTTFVDVTTITAAIPLADVAVPDTATVTVYSPPPGGGSSGGTLFVVRPSGVLSLRVLELDARYLLADPTSGLLYASVWGSGARANSLTQIDPVAGTLGTSVAVGDWPTRIARSDDGQYLYVALSYEGAVRRYNVATETAELKFAVGTDPFLGKLYAEDIAVIPGSPHTVAVSTMIPMTLPHHKGVRIYDDGVARPMSTISIHYVNEIEAASATTLYGADTETSEYRINILTVAATGVSVTQAFPNLGAYPPGEYVLAGGLFYSPGGTAIDPPNGRVAGTFMGGGGPLVVDVPNDLIFYLQANGIAIYRVSNYEYVGTIPITDLGLGEHPVRWGSNGLAFVRGEKVWLLTTSFLPGS
jgi:hypothetical protein